MHTWFGRYLGVALCVALAGCKPEVKEGVFFCLSSDQCPPDMHCDLDVLRCNGTSDSGLATPTVLDGSVIDTRSSAGSFGPQTGAPDAGLLGGSAGDSSLARTSGGAPAINTSVGIAGVMSSAPAGAPGPAADGGRAGMSGVAGSGAVIASNVCPGGSVGMSEACDGVDNDCDGVIDEAVTQPCGIQRGQCLLGIQTCAIGQWGACEGAVMPATEVCDVGQIDEDCDGVANNGCDCAGTETRRCGTSDLGQCRYGMQSCKNGKWDSSCVGSVEPGRETCDAARIDEDCDGMVNEGCACTNGDSRACGSDVGACTVGLQTCSDGNWSICLGSMPALPEVCDAVDNDCNGAVDDGYPCLGSGYCSPAGRCVECLNDTNCGSFLYCSNGTCVSIDAGVAGVGGTNPDAGRALPPDAGAPRQ